MEGLEVESEEEHVNALQLVADVVMEEDLHKEEEEASREGGGGDNIGRMVEKILADLSWKLSSKALRVRILPRYTFVHLTIHQDLEKIVADLSVETPEKTSTTLLLKLRKPRNLEEAIRYCKLLLEHFQTVCDAKKCKHMGKAGPSWVLQRLGHSVADKSTMQDIRHLLTTSTDLFASISRSESVVGT